MKEVLNLPRFDIPDLEEKKLSPAAVQRWMVRNFRLLKDNGVVECVQNDPARCPVDVRFVLYGS
jgi:hypothetical protein